MTETILKASSLYHVYESKAEDGNVVALRGIHVDIKEGEARFFATHFYLII